MIFNFNFNWDINKAISNKKKHKIAFEEAIDVFKDPQALTIYDEDHSANEERWITLGICSISKVLLVVHTYVEYNDTQADIRIISARNATNKEKATYKGDIDER